MGLFSRGGSPGGGMARLRLGAVGFQGSGA